MLLNSKKQKPSRVGIALKLGVLLAAFSILSSGLTGLFTLNSTRQILSDKAKEGMIESAKLLGRRFSTLGLNVANETRLLARSQLAHQSFEGKIEGNEKGFNQNTARLILADQFKSLLSIHPEFYQIRLISAHDYGVELVRVERDNGQVLIIAKNKLQEKQHYPYVYETLKLPEGQAYFSKIFINHEVGIHKGLKQPTLQVATPVKTADGVSLGVIVINVDLNQMFDSLNAELSNNYQLYLTNQRGDYLIHPNKSKTFGFDHGRPYLVQTDFPAVSKIIKSEADALTVTHTDDNQNKQFIGGFTRITFGELSDNRFVIIGVTAPLNKVLAETSLLIQNTIQVVIGFSLIALMLSTFVARFFVRPLKNLVGVVHRFSYQREISEISGYPNDELGVLADSIGQMQSRILTHVNLLDKQNKRLNCEIKEREEIEKFDSCRSHILELIAGDNPLSEILEAIVLGVEQLHAETLCSILQLDREGKHLGKGVAPHLPEFYNIALEGLEIGESVGSCGTAAFTRQRVIVEDIQTHPFWVDYKTLAKQANLASCWSQPIISSVGKVLGTFAIYKQVISSPTDADIEMIVKSASLASIAIERKLANDEVTNLAFYDSLTRLPNRRLLLDRLNQAIATSAHNKKGVALLFIDLDKFKSLNDVLGHDMGDLLLQQTAERIRRCVRESDTVSRLGGDEFVVMLKGLSVMPIQAAEETESVGTKILLSLAETYQLASHQYNVTPSIGATLIKNSHQDVDELFKQADIAMYQSKKSGGNALCFFDPEMQAHLIARIRIETELRNAIDQGGQFELYYQAQVDSLNNVKGSEALLRWNTPARGIVSPMDFIPIAEESGMILPLGHWVLETACQQLAAWSNTPETAHLTLSVNMSAKQMGLPSFVEDVLSLVASYSVNPELLKLEITESILVENLEETTAKMTALKARGIKFSIDDFGTGYSSLQYLKTLPLDQLKIDQSFVQDIENDSSDRAIVRTIIAMANSLNLEVIAEGVETECQRELLVNKGCLDYQGYLFSKPIPIDEFNLLLENNAKKV